MADAVKHTGTAYWYNLTPRKQTIMMKKMQASLAQSMKWL